MQYSSKDIGVVPRHIAIIMDGNGRWAKKRGLPRLMGHRQGLLRVKEILWAAQEMGVQYLTLYAFSSENWQRSKREVGFLMKACYHFLKNELSVLMQKEVRFKHIGNFKELPSYLQAMIKTAEETTRNNRKNTVQLAFNYGSRQELVRAVKNIAGDVKKGTLKLANIDASVVSSYLYTNGMPDPDLLIRTSGEMRISNFLLWQACYSEFYFTKKSWPDFKKEDLLEAIKNYQKRIRRFGGVRG